MGGPFLLDGRFLCGRNRTGGQERQNLGVTWSEFIDFLEDFQAIRKTPERQAWPYGLQEACGSLGPARFAAETSSCCLGPSRLGGPWNVRREGRTCRAYILRRSNAGVRHHHALIEERVMGRFNGHGPFSGRVAVLDCTGR